MSEGSSFSDLSELDVTEGTIANQVHKSQLDSSSRQVSHKRVEVIGSQEMRVHKSTQHAEGIRISSPQVECTDYRDMHFRIPLEQSLDPNCFDYQLLITQAKPVPKAKPTATSNFVKQNKKLVQKLSRRRKNMREEPGSVYSQPRSSNFFQEERFSDYKRSVDGKKDEQRKRQEEIDMKDCTFSPSINDSPRRRNFQEHYSDLMKFQKVKADRLDELKETYKPKENNYSFKPKICDKSAKINKGKAYFTEQCHERLYDIYRCSYKENIATSFYSDNISSNSDISNGPTFVPKVNKKTREMVRTQPIHKLLYQDALRRQNTHPSPAALPPVPISDQSIRILVKKFQSEFKKLSEQLDVDRTGQLNYTRYVALCTAIFPHVHKTEVTTLSLQLWDRLGDRYGHVRLDDLKVALMEIMGY